MASQNPQRCGRRLQLWNSWPAANAGHRTAAATSSAYNAGVAAGTTYAMGSISAALPAGCMQNNVGGGTYYLCGNTWFSPSYGANGICYRVVPTP